MTLRFESLSLKNFGPYRSVDSLELESGFDSPVVVIHGENTLGKTSIFRALRWCLYGAPEAERNSGKQSSNLFDYMNRPAWADGEDQMQVGMSFSANGAHYQLTRRASFDRAGAVKVTADLRLDASVIHPNDIEAEIGRLLHPQISEFFLFDGELLRDFYDRLNTDRERDLLRTSIDNVLGVPALQLAERDVSLLTEDVLLRQSKAMKSATDATNARRQLAALKSRQESLDKDKLEIEVALRKGKSDLADVKLRMSSIENLKADAREMEGLEAQIEGAKREELEVRGAMRSALSAGWRAPVARKLEAALAQVVQRNDLAEIQRRKVQSAQEQVEMLRKQTQGGVCPLCQQDLPPAVAETHEKLHNAELALVALTSGTGAEPDLQFEREIRSLIDTQTLVRFRDLQSRLDSIRRDQFSRNRRLESIKDRMKDNDAAKIRQLATEQERLDRAVASYEETLRDFKPKQDMLSAEQEKAARALGKLGSSQPELAAEAVFFLYVRSLLGRAIERYQERTRAQVELAASEMLARLMRDSHGYSGLRIGRDYKVDLLGKAGDEMITSEGGKQLVALSLIGALKQAAVRGGPVVLDSPLARLDREHRSNVLQQWVPDLGSQAILLVQSGELTEEQAKDIMGTRIGHSYRIYRPNNDPQEAAIERIR
jgi:DNA sulfur modification protein DndD